MGRITADWRHVALLAAVVAALAGAMFVFGMYVALGLSVAATSGVIMFTVRHDRVVGVTGVLAVSIVTVFPLQFVPEQSRLVFLAALTGLTVVVLARRGLPRADPLMGLLLISYLGVTWYATVAAGDPDAAPRFLIHAVVAVAFYVIGAAANVSERESILRAVVVLAALQVGYAIVETMMRPPVLWASPVPEHITTIGDRLPSEIIPGLSRAQGTFGHPLMFSFFLIVALGVALRTQWKSPVRKFWFVTLMLTGALLGGSRSAIVVMVAMVLFSIGSRRTAWLRGILLAALTLAFLALTGFFQSEIVERFSTSGSLTHRVGAFEALPRLLAQQPDVVWFGHGWYAAPRLTETGLLQLDGLVAVDNQIVATLAASGIIGLGLVLALILRGVIGSPPVTRLAFLAATVMFLVFDVLQYPVTWALYTLLLGFAAANLRARKSAAAPDPVTPLRAMQPAGLTS
jgi:hypothetical protein